MPWDRKRLLGYVETIQLMLAVTDKYSYRIFFLGFGGKKYCYKSKMKYEYQFILNVNLPFFQSIRFNIFSFTPTDKAIAPGEYILLVKSSP